MLRVLVTKASNDEYFSIKTFNTLEDLMRFQKKARRVILESSFFYGMPLSVIRESFQVNNKCAKRIQHINIQLIIYDDYIE